MPMGYLLDLWELHRQFMGWSKPKQGKKRVSDIIPAGL